ncbi:helix-turn-helix domain-containing protein [Microlunatus sp. GCM10028923]|uniref:AraC family transcriptional regulator n=1 Tax=Microlunatus sp. GCM10028923 TaxID=3273400 RepID=UPI00360DA001
MPGDSETLLRRYEFVTPPSRLPGLVASATGYQSTGNPIGLHRGLPSPYLTFILALDDAPIIGAETPDEAVRPTAPRAEVLLGGLHARPAYVVQPRDQVGMQLAVHPLAARRLFGPPTRELTDLLGDGTAVLGSGAARLRERMAEAPTWAERFDLLWDYLRRRVEATERAEAPPPALVEGWRWLARFGGTGSMDGLARHLGYSGRRVSQLFGTELGVSPKQIGRLFRFDLARRQIAGDIDRTGRSDLGRVAAERGYYDQSHLVRDFRQYTGTSPSGWIAEEFRNIQAGAHRSPEDSPA